MEPKEQMERSGSHRRLDARLALGLLLGLGLTASLTGCDLLPTPAASTETAASFVAVIDGDTVRTSAGTVRVIGIDTPERGECGYETAAAVVSELFSPGDPLTLVLPRGQNDRDRHDRLLRYVVTGHGTDLGLAQIEAGNAVARYDSRDGYPAHPNEAAYRAAQTAVLDAQGRVVSTTCR